MWTRPRDGPMNWSVADFLDAVRVAISLGSYEWHEHERRLQEIAALGLTRNQVLEEIAKLSARHHHRGPEPDDEFPDEAAVHVFRYPLPGTAFEVYVKLSLRQRRQRAYVMICKIWSFKKWESN